MFCVTMTPGNSYGTFGEARLHCALLVSKLV